jgi:hypothetical protein
MPQPKILKPFDWDIKDYHNLYQHSEFLSKDILTELGILIPVDVYIQDPLVSAQARSVSDVHISKRVEWDPISTITVQREPDLLPGPTTSRIAVVDYDADKNTIEPPAEWDSEQNCFITKIDGEKIPLTKEHKDLPQFHQVNVWAIVQSILNMYENRCIMGRPIPWAFNGNRIILVPHAGELRNAFYDRGSKSIQFYYFHSQDKCIYTCLSHDIIAHETGHAILDGLRPLYLVDSSIETTAFHEFVADTTAIMAGLLNNELRFQTLQETGGDLSRDQIISGLAEEFGYYSYGRPYLRSARNEYKLGDLTENQNPYTWSQVLTGAMFDVLKEILAIRVTKSLVNGRQPSLKQAFAYATNRFRRVAFQPLDYLPPVDVDFSDYARAVLRADELLEPVDEKGYRAAIKGALEGRGIDCSPGEETESIYFYAYDIDRISRSPTDAYHFLNQNRRQLCIPHDQDISVIGLYQTEKIAFGGGNLPREIVLQYYWEEDVQLKGKTFGAFEGEYTTLLCGGTLVFDNRGNLRSWQHKPGTGKQETGRRVRSYCKDAAARGMQRREKLLSYLQDRIATGGVALHENQKADQIGADKPVVVSRRTDGVLRFQTTPHLRHWDEKEGG